MTRRDEFLLVAVASAFVLIIALMIAAGALQQ